MRLVPLVDLVTRPDSMPIRSLGNATRFDSNGDGSFIIEEVAEVILVKLELISRGAT